MQRIVGIALWLLVAASGASIASAAPVDRQGLQDLRYPEERHLANIRQLTFGGQNAEAYFSSDGKELIFQSTRENLACDAIFRMDAGGDNVRMVSSGKGATTCSFISPDSRSIIYASTHLVWCPGNI